MLQEEKNKELEALSYIDRLEQEYLAEYYMLAEKDKAAGRDFNRVAHDHMVRMQGQFDHMRKVEKANYRQAVL